MLAIFHVHARIHCFIRRVTKKANIEIGLHAPRGSSTLLYIRNVQWKRSDAALYCFLLIIGFCNRHLAPRYVLPVIDVFDLDQTHASNRYSISSKCEEKIRQFVISSRCWQLSMSAATGNGFFLTDPFIAQTNRTPGIVMLPCYATFNEHN